MLPFCPHLNLEFFFLDFKCIFKNTLFTVCVPECIYVHPMHVGVCGDQKRKRDSYNWNKQGAVSCFMKPSLDPLQEQRTFLTAEPCLQPSLI